MKKIPTKIKRIGIIIPHRYLFIFSNKKSPLLEKIYYSKELDITRFVTIC